MFVILVSISYHGIVVVVRVAGDVVVGVIGGYLVVQLEEVVGGAALCVVQAEVLAWDLRGGEGDDAGVLGRSDGIGLAGHDLERKDFLRVPVPVQSASRGNLNVVRGRRVLKVDSLLSSKIL